MALQTSGPISLNDIHIEAGGSSGSTVSINDADIIGLISKSSGSEMSFNEWYGATSSVPNSFSVTGVGATTGLNGVGTSAGAGDSFVTGVGATTGVNGVTVSSEITLTSSGTINGQAHRQQITASNFISSGGTLRIPSTLWVWSNNPPVAALTVDIPCTIINEGKIVGRGGAGGDSAGVTAGGAGGDAIKINSSVSNVTIINSSGAYIAGGGGGGSGYAKAGGGGGAGGGRGGFSHNRSGTFALGGNLNAIGNDGQGGGQGIGGEAGGGGGYRDESSGGSEYTTNAGGGGRILPGTQTAIHTTGRSGLVGYGRGGAGGQAGGNGANQGNGQRGAGGGGWGAAGGAGSVDSGGAAGKAIEDSGNSYTLSNSGTIYGATT